MAYAKIENNVVVIKAPYKNNECNIEIDDTIYCGMIRNEDGSFRKPSLSQEQVFEILRLERNSLLSKTDWWVLPDRTPTQSQLDYRQALRDLPSTASPSLDENGNLTNITWPTKPE